MVLCLWTSCGGDKQSMQEELPGIAVNFNCDDIPDRFIGETTDSHYIAAFLISNENGGMDTSRFDIRLRNSDNMVGFCGDEITASIEDLTEETAGLFEEPLSGYQPSDTCKGIRLADNMCDSFHFYWNHDLKEVAVWRL